MTKDVDDEGIAYDKKTLWFDRPLKIRKLLYNKEAIKIILQGRAKFSTGGKLREPKMAELVKFQ